MTGTVTGAWHHGGAAEQPPLCACRRRDGHHPASPAPPLQFGAWVCDLSGRHFTLVGMKKTALGTALAAPRAAFGTKVPPHLRAAADRSRSCGTCKYFKAQSVGGGACRLYDSYAVKATQTCDSWQGSKPQPGASSSLPVNSSEGSG